MIQHASIPVILKALPIAHPSQTYTPEDPHPTRTGVSGKGHGEVEDDQPPTHYLGLHLSGTRRQVPPWQRGVIQFQMPCHPRVR